MISCYLIGENSNIREIKTLIETHPLTSVVGHKESSFPLLLAEVFTMRPHVLIVDFKLRKTIEKILITLTQFLAIVYLSDSPNNAFQAFEDGVVDYLVFPIAFERFANSINKIAMYLSRNTSFPIGLPELGLDSFFINIDPRGKTELLINSIDILFIEAMDNHILIMMTGGHKHFCFNTMKEMEKCLPSYFMRVHKSFIINYRKVKEVKGSTIRLVGDDVLRIPIGITFRKVFIEKKNEITIGKIRMK